MKVTCPQCRGSGYCKYILDPALECIAVTLRPGQKIEGVEFGHYCDMCAGHRFVWEDAAPLWRLGLVQEARYMALAYRSARASAFNFGALLILYPLFQSPLVVGYFGAGVFGNAAVSFYYLHQSKHVQEKQQKTIPVARPPRGGHPVSPHAIARFYRGAVAAAKSYNAQRR